MTSRSFNKGGVRRHLTQGKRGVAGEVEDLRRDVEEGFSALENDSRLIHESMVTASRTVTQPNAGPTYYVNGPFVGLSFALTLGDAAYRIFKVSPLYGSTPSFHIHWTKSSNVNENGKAVKWRISYVMFDGKTQAVPTLPTVIEYEDTYDAVDTTTRVVHRTPDLAVAEFVASYYLSIKVEYVTPSGAPLSANPILYSADLIYRAKINLGA